MEKNSEIIQCNNSVAKEGQCQFFVLRKKRFCRMTVRPGRHYCGEHEPPPDDTQADKRVPCPNDPKHTVYISKLEKHLSICNARRGTQPPYIVPHVNTLDEQDVCPRVPLALIPRDTLMKIIDKINYLYDEHVKDNITTAADRPIHSSIISDFNDNARTESSRRHLRQASRLMWLVEDEGLVDEDTCYIELGAGKGQLSYYMGVSWCEGSSRVLPVDRAALRHKRERRGRGEATRYTSTSPVTDGDASAPRAVTEGDGTSPRAVRERDAFSPEAVREGDAASSRVVRAVRPGAVERVRADLAHLRLELVPHVAPAMHLVGLAKHLCGVATDYAIQCMMNARRARGLVVATCCHHRCEGNTYLGKTHLQSLGVSSGELNVILSVVSWATCGDGRSRDHHKHTLKEAPSHEPNDHQLNLNKSNENGLEQRPLNSPNGNTFSLEESNIASETSLKLSPEYRSLVGRRAKALLDWGRVLRLRSQGFDAVLCYFVPPSVSPENVCIIAKKPPLSYIDQNS